MSAAKAFPSIYCPTHRGVLLVDVVADTGKVESLCPQCVKLELVDTVKQLHRRRQS